jgi:hypothetical protein
MHLIQIGNEMKVSILINILINLITLTILTGIRKRVYIRYQSNEFFEFFTGFSVLIVLF